MRYYLGIDIGTSGTKAVCFDELGNACLSKTVGYDIISIKQGYAEENPLDWLSAVKKTILDITSNGYKINGIGLSGQMHGLVLLDKDDNLLRNSIIWCDNRTYKEALQLKNDIGDIIKEETGNEPVGSFTLAKLLWVKNNEKSIFDKIAKIMLPKDYIRYMLTSSFTTEYSDASGMQMVDIFNKKYSKKILDYVGINENMLPKLMESTEISGYIREDICKELNLDNNCFIVGGAGDQAAAAIGNGVIKKGDVNLVLGSSGVVFTPVDKAFAKRTSMQIFMHAIPDTYHIMGVTNGCGLSYKWLKDKVFNDDYETLNSYANKSKPLANGVIYLPYLNGERTPHIDPFATGTFVGLKQNTNKNDIIRSVLEGICYSLRDCFTLLPKDNYNIKLTGGGAKGSLWRNILASVLNNRLIRIKQDEGGALGVAILAMVADKAYNSIDEAIDKIIKPLDEALPNELWANDYEKGYILYQDLYKSLKEFYKKAYEEERK